MNDLQEPPITTMNQKATLSTTKNYNKHQELLWTTNNYQRPPRPTKNHLKTPRTTKNHQEQKNKKGTT